MTSAPDSVCPIDPSFFHINTRFLLPFSLGDAPLSVIGHGFIDPVYNIGLACRLRGQYVRASASHVPTGSLNIVRRCALNPALSNVSAFCIVSCVATGKMLVVLRDGRKLIGVLRSYDQFGKRQFAPLVPGSAG
jgi:hypothetical protein